MEYLKKYAGSIGAGAFLLMIGVIFSAIGYSMLDDAGVTLKLFTAGPFLAVLGLAMVVFPVEINIDEDADEDDNAWWDEIPMQRKIIYGVALVIGFIISQSVF